MSHSIEITVLYIKSYSIVYLINLIKYFESLDKPVSPIALRKAKIVCNFGLSECNRVKICIILNCQDVKD